MYLRVGGNGHSLLSPLSFSFTRLTKMKQIVLVALAALMVIGNVVASDDPVCTSLSEL